MLSVNSTSLPTAQPPLFQPSLGKVGLENKMDLTPLVANQPFVIRVIVLIYQAPTVC